MLSKCCIQVCIVKTLTFTLVQDSTIDSTKETFLIFFKIPKRRVKIHRKMSNDDIRSLKFRK